MRFITGLLVTGLLSSSVFKVGAVAPKSEVNDTIVDLRPLVYEQPFQRKADKITDAKWFQMRVERIRCGKSQFVGTYVGFRCFFRGYNGFGCQYH